MTVGSGIAPDLLTLPLWTRKALAGSIFCISADPDTAGGELHPALRTRQLCRDTAEKSKQKRREIPGVLRTVCLDRVISR
jgi:hypothetical protein